MLLTRPGKMIRYVNYTVPQDVLLISNTPSIRWNWANPSTTQPVVYQYSPKNETLLFPARNLGDI